MQCPPDTRPQSANASRTDQNACLDERSERADEDVVLRDREGVGRRRVWMRWERVGQRKGGVVVVVVVEEGEPDNSGGLPVPAEESYLG